MLRHLLQPHVMTYISSHPEVFYKKSVLKVSLNSQENSCGKVSFSYNFNKNEALEMAVPHEFCENILTLKYKRQMCANVSWEKTYMFWVDLLSRFEYNVFTANAADVLLYDWRSKILLLWSYL